VVASLYAANTTMFYSGAFRVDTEKIVVFHEVKFTTCKQFFGETLPRTYEFNTDGTLILTTIPRTPDKPVIELVWKRS